MVARWSLSEPRITANVYVPHAPTMADRSSFQMVLSPLEDRLIKAKSEQSLVALPVCGPSTAVILSEVAKRLRSRSLQPLHGLAVWSPIIVTITLIKGNRGLGFSIMDYQDPCHPTESVLYY